MTHPLTEIRRAAASVLKRHFKRVYDNRATAPALAQLPCAVVYVHSRSSEEVGFSPLLLRHTVDLAVVLCVQASEGADAVAEEMLAVAEQAFYADRSLGVAGLSLEGLMPVRLNIESDDTGEVVTSYYQQIWRLSYFEEVSD